MVGGFRARRYVVEEHWARAFALASGFAIGIASDLLISGLWQLSAGAAYPLEGVRVAANRRLRQAPVGEENKVIPSALP